MQKHHKHISKYQGSCLEAESEFKVNRRNILADLMNIWKYGSFKSIEVDHCPWWIAMITPLGVSICE